MKKYYPVDFDEKGNVVLGNAKNTPTSNGFIPTTWAPGGSDEGKQGLKSITISPAITTTPALESLFPIYWEDLTEEQRRDGITINCASSGYTPGEYTITVEPTGEWYAGVSGWGSNQHVSENAGESVTATTTPVPSGNFAVVGMSTPDGSGDMVMVNINLEYE